MFAIIVLCVPLCQISIQPVFRQQPEMKSSLIPEMVKNKKITPDIILQYCRLDTYCYIYQYVLYKWNSIVIKSYCCPFCSTFGLDRDRVINQYITTLLLLQGDENSEDVMHSDQEETQPLCEADTLDRVLQIIPMLHSTSELTNSLCTAIFKVRAAHSCDIKHF